MRRQGHYGDGASDEALLSGVALGDERAVLIFVRRYQRRLFGLALGIVGDSGMAEDVAQEAFIRILRHAAVYDVRRGSVATWTLTITRNLAIDALRVRRPIPTAPEDRAFLDLISSERLPDDAAAMSESVAQARSLSPLFHGSTTSDRPRRDVRQNRRRGRDTRVHTARYGEKSNSIGTGQASRSRDRDGDP